MRHKLIAVLSLFVVSLFLFSCNEEWIRSELAELTATGIKLKNKDCAYFGSIPSSGGEITLTATGKRKEAGYLSSISAPEFFLGLQENRPTVFPTTVCDEAWGKVEVLSDDPHTTRLTFHPNKSGLKIDYIFVFGELFVGSNVYITQQAQ